MHVKKCTKKPAAGLFVTQMVKEVELLPFDQLVSPGFEHVARVKYIGHNGGYTGFFFEVFTKTLKFIHVVGPDCVSYDVWEVDEAPIEQSVRRIFS